VLLRVVLIKGFHVNIVSEAFFLKQNVWYSSYNYSLNYSELRNSIIIKKLKRRF
jgi:hypothetical protein